MKALVCELCGGNDFVKEGDFFICQSCGTKYSSEAAKKMMIEGTVDVQGTVLVKQNCNTFPQNQAIRFCQGVRPLLNE